VRRAEGVVASAAGRERLRHYRSRGYEIKLHEVRG